MNVEQIEPPRRFEVGFEVKRTIADCARIRLEPDEQVTFTTEAGGEVDVTRKDFGFYAAPSLNARLRQFKFRPVLVRNRVNRFFVLLVEEGKEGLFERYLGEERLDIVTWMDSTEVLSRIAQAVESHGKPSN